MGCESLETGQDPQERAFLALGRLDGMLRHATSLAIAIFAARVLRLTLIRALRHEGHAFTEHRFSAWFAGLATLSDMPPRHARPPRAICEAILTELAHGSWPELRATAERFKGALLAPRDHAAQGAHEEALAITSRARKLVARCIEAHPPGVAAALNMIHRQIADSKLFAPVERESAWTSDTSLPGLRPVSPIWAAEMLFAQCLHAKGTLPFALPLPGLLATGAANPDSDDAGFAQLAHLASAAEHLLDGLTHDIAQARHCCDRLGHRSTSRAPDAFALIAGFGPMRSAQVESLVGASRLGVRGMLASLDQAGLIDRRKVSGAVLFGAAETAGSDGHTASDERDTPFSSEAMDEYEASLAAIDRLLRGHEAID